MYTLDEESVQKLAQTNNLLNLLEVRGAGNIDVMYQSMVLLQGVLQLLQAQKDSVVLDNTKKEKEV